MNSHVTSYTLTDQQYVMKLLNENLTQNTQQTLSSKSRKGPKKASTSSTARPQVSTNLSAQVLDWEEDIVSGKLAGTEGKESFDVVIACDCIYNDALIDPLVRTSVDASKLRKGEERPTVVVVAQQLRSPEVFEGWLKAFHKYYRVWRVPDEELIDGLEENSGFVIHIGVLR